MKHERNTTPAPSRIVSEWEDNILFDIDDPDFCNTVPNLQESELNVLQQPPIVASGLNSTSLNASYSFKVPSNMSIAGVHNFTDLYPQMARNSISVSSSLSDLVGSPLEISVDNVITIEELRSQIGSCFTCGVSWVDDHVSLDCSECGSYSCERPCPLCDGKCGVQWKRDFTMSHASRKARWLGVCPSYPEAASALNDPNIVNSNHSTITAGSCAAANQVLLAKELCARLEQLSTQT